MLDERTLLIPDRPGNNQVDSLQNVIAHPEVGLLFLVPGMNETLRVSGTAEIVTDEALLAPLAIGRKAPPSGLRITVEEAFLHCGRSLIRSRLWEVDAQIDRACYPTYGQVLADQIRGANAAEIDASEAEAQPRASLLTGPARGFHAAGPRVAAQVSRTVRVPSPSGPCPGPFGTLVAPCRVSRPTTPTASCGLPQRARSLRLGPSRRLPRRRQ